MNRWSNIVWALTAGMVLAAGTRVRAGRRRELHRQHQRRGEGRAGRRAARRHRHRHQPGADRRAHRGDQRSGHLSLPVGASRRVPACRSSSPAFRSSVREGIRITLGFNAQVNVQPRASRRCRKPSTVSGESPVIDTSATRIQTNYDQQMLSSIPNARDMWSLLATTPSVTLNRVDVGGSTAGTQTTYFAYGYSGQNRPLIEGINTTEGTSAAGFYLDYGSFEEVFIGAAGNSAEMPNPGVLTQFVGKSGGNTPVVSLYYDYENERHPGPEPGRRSGRWSRRPGTTIRPDGNRLASYKNLNLGVGGPIIKDRMWGHFAYLNQQNSVAAPPAGVFLDGTPFDTKLFNYTGKAHLPAEPGQQVHRLPAARHQAAAEPHRQQHRARRAGAHHRRFDGAAGLAELGLQGRVERHDRPEHVRRVPRRPVRLQLRPRQQHRRDALRDR